MKKFYLLLFSSIVLSSCQVEEPILPEEQKNTALNTVSIEMALSALSESSSKFMTKQGEEAYVVPRPEEFYYSDIGNSHEKLLIIPARHKNPGVYSRIFILEVNGVIQTRVFNMYPEQPQTSPYFSGEIGIFNLEGEFLNGFRVKNGQRISILTESKIVNKMVSDGVCQEHGNCYERSICIHCEQSLDEVIINAPAPSEPENIDVPTLYPDYEPDGNEEPQIDYGGGPSDGGAGDNSTTNNTAEEDIETFLDKDVWDEQDPYDDWNRLTQCEKDFFSSKPYHLPIARANKNEAENAAFKRFGSCVVPQNAHPLRNTIGDAYRHSYFAALNTQSMGYSDAKALGDAHECGTPVEYLDEKEMDLHNNDWGYFYGDTMSYVDEAHFYTSFLNAVQNGQINILQECL